MADYLTVHNDVNDSASPAIKTYLGDINFYFQDSLTYQGVIYDSPSLAINDSEVKAYESALQYVDISLPSGLEYESNENLRNTYPDQTTLSEIFQSTIQRCSLIRYAFQIVAEGENYEQLATKALNNGSFDDIMQGGINQDATWSIRLRRYGSMKEAVSTAQAARGTKASKTHPRYGKNVRSSLRGERNAIHSMLELVELFQGKVDLANPECRIYLLEGLKRCDIMSSRHGDDSFNHHVENDPDGVGDVEKTKLFLARVIAQGPTVCVMV